MHLSSSSKLFTSAPKKKLIVSIAHTNVRSIAPTLRQRLATQTLTVELKSLRHHQNSHSNLIRTEGFVIQYDNRQHT